eukprot:gene11178-10978_t
MAHDATASVVQWRVQDEPKAALTWLEEQKTETAKKSRGLFSPLKIIECVQAALQLPFDEGMARER